jgi:hypothetical protein
MRIVGLVITWAIATTVAGMILWVPIGSTCHAVAGPLGTAGVMPVSFLFLLYTPYVALRAVVYGTPFFIIVFALWAIACRHRPSLDSARPLALFALLASLPGSCLVAALMAQSAAAFSWNAFVWSLPFYYLVFWGAIMSPRWLVEPLMLGAFSQPLADHGRGQGAAHHSTSGERSLP